MDGPHGLGVTAEDFGLEGPRGRVFGGLRVDAEPGSLIAIEGPSGSGRTCLLLALTGRMRPTEGTARVGSSRLPQQMAAVRRTSGLAHVPGVTDLDPALTVGEHLRERALLEQRFGGPLRGLLRSWSKGARLAGGQARTGGRAAGAKLRIDSALSAAGLDRESLPKGSRTAVRDLERLESLRLSIALALIGRPRLLGVDDTDLKLSDSERAEVWALLRSIADSGTTVVAVCSEAPEGAVVVSTRPHGEQGAAAEDAATPADADATTATDSATPMDAGTPTDSTADTGTALATRDGGPAQNTPATGAGTPDKNTPDDEETADALAETGRS
ncbi:ATP-binding cassette domain-containing protein [Streptomyces sp. 142MFCol3.1]|uniref:ATP-binding cassette domain-containing protein n=1 Tax=Streptomyces sp. 142MFCol3.1 TaxID=1172179 RepID=UPI00041064FC|nr:ATP-binding cassette domain-containing protein [Streptomyces sp. 142MFCol3.1]